MKHRLSYKTVLYLYVIISFLILTILGYYGSTHLYRLSRKQMEDGFQRQLERTIVSTSEEIESVRQSVILIALSLNSDINSIAKDEMDMQRQRAAANTLLELGIKNEIVQMVYVSDFKSQWIVSSSPAAEPKEILELRKALLREELEISSLSSDQWNQVTIEGRQYLHKGYQMYGLTMGCLISCDRLEERFLMNEEEVETMSFFTLEDQGDIETARDGGLWDFVKGEETLSFAQKVPRTPLVIHQTITVKNSHAYMSSLWSKMAITSGVFLALFSLLAFFVNFLIRKPLDDIIRVMEEVKSGHLEARIKKIPVTKEYAFLAQEFNHVMDEVMHLRIAEYEHEIQKTDLNLKLLRAQIKPHAFLNALTTVQGLVYQQKTKEAMEYLKAFSVHVRNQMNVTSEMISLETEIDHIESYITMQKIRFPQSVFLVVDCDREFYSWKVPHLVIYTFIENAIKHAMNLDETLTICLTVKPYSNEDQEYLYIEIEDDGSGFPDEMVQRYQTSQPWAEMEGHLGMYNIYRTLKLLYGREDLLKVYNVDPRGAGIQIILPRIKEIQGR